MQKLKEGIHQFQQDQFRSMHELFESLANGQNPETLFITCSDSRIDPGLLTQSQPGDLFILRNAGNIVPPHGSPRSGEAATIEYAVSVLQVRDIIVCGHSQCGAMQGLLNPDSLTALPSVSDWLTHAQTTKRIIDENYAELDEDRKLSTTIEENVLVQLEHLRTLPSVASRIARGDVHLHGWYYKIETGEVFAYDPVEQQFVPLAQYEPVAASPRRI